MTGPRNALAAWSQSALRPVVLPSGLKALVKLPDVNMLVRTGKVPQELTDVALKFATTGVNVSQLAGPEIVEFIRLTYVLTADSLEYLAMPDSPAWDQFRETGGSPVDEGWEPVSLTGDELAEMRVDQADLEALAAIAGRVKTANEVTLASRVDRGLLDEKGAGEPDADERVGDLAPFRGVGVGAPDRGDGGTVRATAERADRRPGSRRRTGARSGDRD